MLNILYTCDDEFLDLTNISIASVIENNKNRDICFYIATEKKDSENLNKLTSFYKDNNKISFKFLDCTMYDDLLDEKKLDKWGSNSYYVYWKLFAYDLLDVDYVWYLDSDVLCLNPISNPAIDKTIGAVIDSAHADYNRLAHIDEKYYFFNTGSLFVNVKKWKENKCINRVINYINDIRYKPLMCDQDILAICLQDEIEILNPKFNYFAGYDYYGVDNSFEMYSLDKKPFYKKKEIMDAKKEIVIYHCLGGVFGRPWQDGNNSPIKEEFEKYRMISACPDFHSEYNKSLLFKIESKLELLPAFLYNKIHNLAQRIYLRNLVKNNQE